MATIVGIGHRLTGRQAHPRTWRRACAIAHDMATNAATAGPVTLVVMPDPGIGMILAAGALMAQRAGAAVALELVLPDPVPTPASALARAWLAEMSAVARVHRPAADAERCLAWAIERADRTVWAGWDMASTGRTGVAVLHAIAHGKTLEPCWAPFATALGLPICKPDRALLQLVSS